MEIRERKIPSWLIIITGLIIILASLFILVDRVSGLKVLMFLVGLGALSFSVFNFVIAFKNRDESDVCIPHLVHGLINIVLFLLIIVIRKTPTLLGIIIACWLIVFGVFEIMSARHSESSRRRMIGALLAILGLIVLIIPIAFSIDYLILIAIVGLGFGIYRTILGILIIANHKEGTSRIR